MVSCYQQNGAPELRMEIPYALHLERSFFLDNEDNAGLQDGSGVLHSS